MMGRSVSIGEKKVILRILSKNICRNDVGHRMLNCVVFGIIEIKNFTSRST